MQFRGGLIVATVGIGIPVFNMDWSIGKTLISFINQSFKDIQIIVSDDSSTDKTKEAVKEIAEKSDGRISLISNETNLGPSKNTNRCITKLINEVRPDFVIISCADDYFVDMKALEKGVDALKSNPQIGAVYFSWGLALPDGKIKSECRYSHLPNPFSGKDFISYILTDQNRRPIGGMGSFMVRREIYEGFPFPPFTYRESNYQFDTPTWCEVLSRAGLVYYLRDEICYLGIISGKNITGVGRYVTEFLDRWHILDDFGERFLDETKLKAAQAKLIRDLIIRIAAKGVSEGEMKRLDEFILSEGPGSLLLNRFFLRALNAQPIKVGRRA
ncbi:MAG: glycosyltransferase [Candidatus Dadabacteria bacterium]|nr:MAG: glycosyltransferase [Candidatus Dadabacteria bacterium]